MGGYHHVSTQHVTLYTASFTFHSNVSCYMVIKMVRPDPLYMLAKQWVTSTIYINY